MKQHPLKEGLLLQYKDLYAEASPLAGYSKERVDDLIAISVQEINSLYKHIENSFIPTSVPPSLAFALLSIHMRLTKPIAVPVSALLMGSFEEIVKQAKRRKACSSFKIKLSSFDLWEAIALIKSIKQIYPSHQLRLDCNRSWSLEEALFFASYFKDEDFAYLEEPCKSLDETISFTKKSGFPIALDESLRELLLQELFALPIRAVIIKPTLIGDIRPYVVEANKKKVDLVFSSSFESGLGLSAIAQFSKKYPSLDPGIDTIKWIADDLLEKKPYYSEGRFLFPSLTIDQKKCCFVP